MTLFTWTKGHGECPDALLGTCLVDKFPQPSYREVHPLGAEILEWQRFGAQAGIPMAQPVVVLDLRMVDLLASADLNQFILLHRSLDEKGGELHLIGLTRRVREVFQVTRLDRYFARVESLKEGGEDEDDTVEIPTSSP